jgi:hypothetical protein
MDFQSYLTLRHLRVIKVVGRELSLSRAAEILNTSQPAISRVAGRAAFWWRAPGAISIRRGWYSPLQLSQPQAGAPTVGPCSALQIVGSDTS